MLLVADGRRPRADPARRHRGDLADAAGRSPRSPARRLRRAALRHLATARCALAGKPAAPQRDAVVFVKTRARMAAWLSRAVSVHAEPVAVTAPDSLIRGRVGYSCGFDRSHLLRQADDQIRSRKLFRARRRGQEARAGLRNQQKLRVVAAVLPQAAPPSNGYCSTASRSMRSRCIGGRSFRPLLWRVRHHTAAHWQFAPAGAAKVIRSCRYRGAASRAMKLSIQ